MKPTPPRPALPILPAAKSSPPGKANPLYTFHAYGRVGSDVVCWHCGSLPHCSMARTCLTAGGPTPGVIERARYSSCLKTRPTAAAREISPDLRISPQISAARGVRGGRGGEGDPRCHSLLLLWRPAPPGVGACRWRREWARQWRREWGTWSGAWIKWGETTAAWSIGSRARVAVSGYVSSGTVGVWCGFGYRGCTG